MTVSSQQFYYTHLPNIVENAELFNTKPDVVYRNRKV
jgi:hypothetical protein